MQDSLIATLVVDNKADSDKLMCEHGLSWIFQLNEDLYVYDTGQGPALGPNASYLGLELTKVKAVIFSHGHYDHTGGLKQILDANPTALIYGHPNIISSRYGWRVDKCPEDIGMTDVNKEALLANDDRWVKIFSYQQVAKGMWLTGVIPRQCPLETNDPHLFCDKLGENRDLFEDDNSVFFETEGGIVVFLGCCHAGVVNTLRYIQEITSSRQICAVLGGMHLGNATEVRVKQTIETLSSLGVQIIAPCHCTGESPMAIMKDTFGCRYCHCVAGSIFKFKIASAYTKETINCS